MSDFDSVDPGYSRSREKAFADLAVDHPRLVMALGAKMRSLLDTGALNRDRFMVSFDGRLYGLLATEYKGAPVLTIPLMAHSLHDI